MSDIMPVLGLVLIGSIAFFNLRGYPPFVDESIDLWWLWRIEVAGEWLRPLRDGKPLEAWLVAPLARFGEPLTLMRGLHVIAGIVGILLVYAIARRITTRGAAFAAAALAAVSPFVVFFERLSIADSYLFAAAMLVLLSALSFCEAQSWRTAAMMAMALVLAAITKFPIGFIFAGALPLALICMSGSGRSRVLQAGARLKLLVAYVPVAVLLLAVAVVAAIQMRRGELPGFGLHMVLTKSESGDRLATIASNVLKLADDVAMPLTWPVVVIAVIGVLVAIRLGDWRWRWLTLMAILPIAGMVVTSAHWSSRYYLFAVPALTISAVCGYHFLWRSAGRVGSAVVISALTIAVVVMGHQSALLIFDPPSARWSKADGYQYIRDWPSGYGFAELADYVRSSPGPPPAIYTLEVGTAMQLRASFAARDEWVERVQQIQIVEGRALSPEEQRAYLLSKAPAWLAARSALEKDVILSLRLRPIAAFGKPRSDVKVTLYEVEGP